MLEKGLLASGLMASQLLLAPLAIAGPEGGVVVSGKGSVTSVSPLETHIAQESQNLLMNFDSFDVGVDESVLITQPNAAAWFVGRIVGGSPTAIFGNITANGRIALVNPRGVIFGETSSISAASVFASSLDLNTDDLFSGEEITLQAVTGAGGYVINHGLISASLGGEVTLLGETVANTGVILATLGHVNLASGSRAVVRFGSEQLIGIEITAEVLENNAGLRAAVSNTGTINADGGTVMLTSSVSKSLFDYAVNNTGVIKAKQAEYKNGVIRLFGAGSSVLNTGTLDASSTSVDGGRIQIVSTENVIVTEAAIVVATSAAANGGTVELSGKNVLVSNNSLVDVSGAIGGGSILIVANETASLDSSVSLVADATLQGDGGLISVSAETVNFSASVSAVGGDISGYVVTVELTALIELNFNGS
ncbi:MAG: filamentous hemagglutinin N-terminal domain-containing protein, partial [Proteobacteria bacterium]|nr:filamentous hemagglutinin N-terminal domain-containing protein [Pseudomonadota bacterium]